MVRVEGEALRRCEEQRGEFHSRGEQLLSLCPHNPDPWLADVATTRYYTRPALYTETRSGSGLVHLRRRWILWH